MLRTYIREHEPTFLTTYTRNPSILRMVDSVSQQTYPLLQDDELQDMALQMPNASMHDVAYHIHRYGEDGLFRGSDPADRSFVSGEPPIKQRFALLNSVRNALVVAARLR